MYQEEAVLMKHTALKYMQSVKALQRQLEQSGTGIPVGAGTGVGVIPSAPEEKYSLSYTDNGFPVLPRPLNTKGWSKRHLEQLQKEYMSCHYSEWPVNI